MIENDEQLSATHEALGLLYGALASLRQTVLSVNPRQYELLAEGPLDEIRKLQSEIDQYLDLRQHDELPIDTAVIREAPPDYRDSGTSSQT